VPTCAIVAFPLELARAVRRPPELERTSGRLGGEMLVGGSAFGSSGESGALDLRLMGCADEEGEVVPVGPGDGRDESDGGLAESTAGPCATPVLGVRTCVDAVVGVEVDDVE